MTLKLISTVAAPSKKIDDTYIDNLLLPLPSLDPETREREDVSSYLFELCKRLNNSYLEARGITFLFDVNGGWLHGMSCRIVGLIVTALVIDLVAHARAKPKDGVITVKLHRWGTVWVCSVADRDIFAVRLQPWRPAEITRRLAQRLNTTLVREETNDGGSTEFVFKPAA